MGASSAANLLIVQNLQLITQWCKLNQEKFYVIGRKWQITLSFTFFPLSRLELKFLVVSEWCHDTLHNDTRFIDILHNSHHKGLICDTQHKLD